MKRFVMWLIVALMTIAGAVAARAEGTPEVPPAADNPTVGYKGGFFIKNGDESFILKIKGRIQPLYQFSKSTGGEAQSTFKLRRARVDFSSVIGGKGHFDLSLQHSTRSAKYQTMNVANATAGYDFHPAFTVVMGTVGMPLSISGSAGSLNFHLIEPALALTQEDGDNVITPLRSSFGNPDGLGLEFTGEISRFMYDISIVNGASRPIDATATDGPSGGVESNYDLNFKKRISAGARFAWNVLEPTYGGKMMDLPYSEKARLTLSIGANYQGTRKSGDDAGAGYIAPTVSRILTYSTGGQFMWRGLSITGEVFGRKTTLSDPGTTVAFAMSMDDFGYLLDAGYFIIPNKFEVAGSVSQIFREGPNNNSYEFGGALNYYILPGNLKAQLVYTLSGVYNDVTETQTTKTHTISTMMSASF